MSWSLSGLVINGDMVIYDNLEDIPIQFQQFAIDQGEDKTARRYHVPVALFEGYHGTDTRNSH